MTSRRDHLRQHMSDPVELLGDTRAHVNADHVQQEAVQANGQLVVAIETVIDKCVIPGEDDHGELEIGQDLPPVHGTVIDVDTGALAPVRQQLFRFPYASDPVLTGTEGIGHPAQVLMGVPQVGRLPVEDHRDLITFEENIARLEIAMDQDGRSTDGGIRTEPCNDDRDSGSGSSCTRRISHSQ